MAAFGWLLLIYLFSLASYIFVSITIDVYQRYFLSSDGLYIIKLSAIIFIPKDLIRGFVYKDYSGKSGRGGGLLKIGGMVTIVNVNNFSEFLDLMKQYGFVTEAVD